MVVGRCMGEEAAVKILNHDREINVAKYEAKIYQVGRELRSIANKDLICK